MSSRLSYSSKSNLLIQETATLFEAIQRLEQCRTAFTIFAVNKTQQIMGVLSRGDVIRYLCKKQSAGPVDMKKFFVREAMTPRSSRKDSGSSNSMLFLEENVAITQYEQITKMRCDNPKRWYRIKLLPVLSDDFKLLNILDLESPHTRTSPKTSEVFWNAGFARTEIILTSVLGTIFSYRHVFLTAR